MKIIKAATVILSILLFACSSTEPEIILPDIVETGVVGKMIKVQGGTFTMGCSDCAVDEAPVREVTLSTYYIGEFEILQSEWVAVMEEVDPSYNTVGDSLPVEQVSWNQVSAFITKLNASTGKKFRLPTEAEWEFAARGGVNSLGYTYSGSNDIDEVAWYLDNNEDEISQKVGQKQANELGLFDMSGNVAEWCQDRYWAYKDEAETNPTGPNSGTTRVFRGGRCDFDANDCTVSVRRSDKPANKYYNLGFRLVMVP